MTGVVERPQRYVLRLLGLLVPASQHPFAGSGVDDVGIARIGHNIAAFSSAHFVPVLPADITIVCPAGDGDCRVVLLGAINVVEKLVVGGYVVELRGWLVVLRAPGLSAVDTDRGSAVIAIDHAARICGINP